MNSFRSGASASRPGVGRSRTSGFNSSAPRLSGAGFSRPSTGGGSFSRSAGPSRFSGGSRPSFGGRPRFGGGSSRFGGGRGGRGGRSDGSHIHISKFIKKADPAAVLSPLSITHTFADFALDPNLYKNIVAKGYEKPSAIQDQAIGPLLAGQDLVGIADTGTGKTGAFLIPLIQHAKHKKPFMALIVTPTRELAVQIEEELRSLSRLMGLFSVLCIGGTNMRAQERSFRYVNDFVIGTPGRIKDLIERGILDLSECTHLVLDETDRMLDMGFIVDVRYIVSKTPKSRQTLFFSATTTPEVNRLIGEFLRDPKSISVKTGDTSKFVDQDVVEYGDESKKLEVLHTELLKDGASKVLIFVQMKHSADRLTKELVARGFKADCIHGDKRQSQRKRALDLYKQNHVNILVATDVAARGLDIKGVSHVINYDLPSTYEDYVHRIGRTGRAGKAGIALTFVKRKGF